MTKALLLRRMTRHMHWAKTVGLAHIMEWTDAVLCYCWTAALELCALQCHGVVMRHRIVAPGVSRIWCLDMPLAGLDAQTL